MTISLHQNLLRKLAVCLAFTLYNVNICADGNTPAMGWSSWNTYHVNISDSLIMGQADALVRLGLKDVGYAQVNIDDGFFGHRDPSGKIQDRLLRGRNGTGPRRTPTLHRNMGSHEG